MQFKKKDQVWFENILTIKNKINFFFLQRAYLFLDCNIGFVKYWYLFMDDIVPVICSGINKISYL